MMLADTDCPNAVLVDAVQSRTVCGRQWLDCMSTVNSAGLTAPSGLTPYVYRLLSVQNEMNEWRRIVKNVSDFL